MKLPQNKNVVLTLACLRGDTPCFFLYVLWTFTQSSMKSLIFCGFFDLSGDESELLDLSLLSFFLKNCEQQQPMLKII